MTDYVVVEYVVRCMASYIMGPNFIFFYLIMVFKSNQTLVPLHILPKERKQKRTHPRRGVTTLKIWTQIQSLNKRSITASMYVFEALCNIYQQVFSNLCVSLVSVNL